jgi:hypothetical protein
MLNLVKAQTEGQPDAPAEQKGPLDVMEQMADINEKNATAEHKRATSQSMRNKDGLSPLQLMAEHAQRDADRFSTSIHKLADRGFEHFHRNADREQQARDREATLQAARERPRPQQ